MLFAILVTQPCAKQLRSILICTVSTVNICGAMLKFSSPVLTFSQACGHRYVNFNPANTDSRSVYGRCFYSGRDLSDFDEFQPCEGSAYFSHLVCCVCWLRLLYVCMYVCMYMYVCICIVSQLKQFTHVISNLYHDAYLYFKGVAYTLENIMCTYS